MKFKVGEIGIVLPNVDLKWAAYVGTEATIFRYLTELDFAERPSLNRENKYLIILCDGRMAIARDKHLRKKEPPPQTGEDSIMDMLKNPNLNKEIA